MSATEMCDEVEDLWLGLCASDRSELSMCDVVVGFAAHYVRHECDLLDVRGCVVDLLLLMSTNSATVTALGAEVEAIVEEDDVWRDCLLCSLGNLVIHAEDRASAEAVAAGRELYRLCGRWGLPPDVAKWCG